MTEDRPDRVPPVTGAVLDGTGFTALDPLPPLLRPYPELAPVISLAVDAVIHLFDLHDAVDGVVIERLNEAATIRTVDLYTSMATIATRSAEGARRSWDIRGAEVARAAEDMATRVAEIAANLQAREEVQAAAVAHDAAAAADRVATAGVDQSMPRAEETAAQIAAAVRTAAATAVRERARTAATLASRAASAAREMTRTVELENIALELETSTTAAALRAIMLETCYQAALDAAATEAGETLRTRYAR